MNNTPMPKEISSVVGENWDTLKRFAEEHKFSFNMVDRWCSCDDCQWVLDQWHERNPDGGKMVKETVAQIESLINSSKGEQYARGYADGKASVEKRQTPTPKVFNLIMVVDDYERTEVCGHEDVLWLIRKAQELSRTLSDMTPNITFEVQDNRWSRVATIFEGGTVTIH